jgi:hypothetical protein
MAIYKLTPAQELLYDEGGWAEWRLLETINEDLDRQGIREPVAIVAANGLATLAWLTAERGSVCPGPP